MKRLIKPTLCPHGIPWGHRVGLMSLLMIHKAYMPVYSDPDFSCGTDGTDGTGRTDQPKVVQEVLADLKMKGVTSHRFKRQLDPQKLKKC